MNPLMMRIARFWSAVTALCVCSGCVATQRSVEGPPPPIKFTVGDPPARVSVYRDLTERAQPTAKISKLEAFLYGPAEPSRRRLRNPLGMAVHATDLYVCDQGLPGVVRVNLVTGSMRIFSRPSERPASPVDVAVDSGGRVYVADATYRRVLVYDDEGRLLKELAPERGDASSFLPSALLVSDRTLYVADRGTRSIERYEIDHERWTSTPFVSDDRVNFGAPTGLAMTGDGILLVADAVLGVVHRIASDGTPLSPIGARGRGTGQLVRPVQVACSASGRVYVSDAARQSVVVFDSAGRYLLEIAGPEGSWLGMTLPIGVVSIQDYAASAKSDRPAGPNDRADEWIVVSDCIGADSLVVIGVDYP